MDPRERIVDESFDVRPGRIPIGEALDLRARRRVHLARVDDAISVRVGPIRPVAVVVLPIVQQQAPPAVVHVVAVRVHLVQRETDRRLDEVRPGRHQAGQVDEVIRPNEIGRALVGVVRHDRPRALADPSQFPVGYVDRLPGRPVVILHGERVRRRAARRQQVREARIGRPAVGPRHPIRLDAGSREVVCGEAVPIARGLDPPQGVREAVAHDLGIVVRVIGGAGQEDLGILVAESPAGRVLVSVHDEGHDRGRCWRRQRRPAPHDPRREPAELVEGSVAGRPCADRDDVRLGGTQRARAPVRPRLHVAEGRVGRILEGAEGRVVARRRADGDDAAARGRRGDGPKPMSAVAARDGEGRVRVHEGVVLHPPGREVPAVVEGPGEAEGRGGDLGLVPRVRDPVVPFSDEREHVVEESACVDVADGDQLRLRGESEDGAGLVLRNDRRRTERPVVPAARRERVADLERDEVARSRGRDREAVARAHHVAVGDRMRPVPDEVDEAAGEVREAVAVGVRPDVRRRDGRSFVVAEGVIVIEVHVDGVVDPGGCRIRDEDGDEFAIVAAQREVRVEPEVVDPARARDAQDVVHMAVERQDQVARSVRGGGERRVDVPGARRGREGQPAEEIGRHRIRIEGHRPVEVRRRWIGVPGERALEVRVAEIGAAVHRGHLDSISGVTEGPCLRDVVALAGRDEVRGRSAAANRVQGRRAGLHPVRRRGQHRRRDAVDVVERRDFLQ